MLKTWINDSVKVLEHLKEKRDVYFNKNIEETLNTKKLKLSLKRAKTIKDEGLIKLAEREIEVSVTLREKYKKYLKMIIDKKKEYLEYRNWYNKLRIAFAFTKQDFYGETNTRISISKYNAYFKTEKSSWTIPRTDGESNNDLILRALEKWKGDH